MAIEAGTRSFAMPEGETADPSAALPRQAGAGGMTKGRVVNFIKEPLDRMDRKDTAGPSTALPRISCRTWWRWRSSCGFPYSKQHTWALLGAAQQEIRVRYARRL
jgi:hypothetical protein